MPEPVAQVRTGRIRLQQSRRAHREGRCVAAVRTVRARAAVALALFWSRLPEGFSAGRFSAGSFSATQ